MELCSFCKLNYYILILVICFSTGFSIENTYKFCFDKDMQPCNALRYGNSKVECVKSLDNANCSILINKGTADFGIFSPEGLFLTHQFYPDDLMVIAELRHKLRTQEDFMFEAVAVASSAYQPSDVPLRGNGFCHPGFNDTSTWNDYILKHFEKELYGRSKCQANLSVVENEVYNLREYFGKACRPGKWVLNHTLDMELKRKYPELCALCDKYNCEYNNPDHHGHYGALDCLVNGRGAVAYVALSNVRRYFKKMSEKSLDPSKFKFVCPGGNTEPLTSPKPCTWIKQPWNSIVVRKSIAEQLHKDLQTWKNGTYPENDWRTNVIKLLEDGFVSLMVLDKPITTETFLRRGRDVKLPESNCGNEIKWCTLNDMETSKCKWVAAEAAALGIEPKITCEQTAKLDRSLKPASKEASLFQCFSKIAQNHADVMTVDSNYGLLVRQVYNLSNLLYCGTDIDSYSVVLTVLKEDSAEKIKSFNDLKGKKACFPEFGGIAWLSFLNIARLRGLVGKSCDYPKVVADFFSNACVPGVEEDFRWNSRPDSKVIDKLCSICISKLKDSKHGTCAANSQNEYYGILGAMKCLKEGVGDVAFVEAEGLLKNMSYYNLNPKEYRVLCKNGSLAQYTGFEVDDQCALSVAIDSEVVSRRKNSPIETSNIKNAFLKIEDWLGYRPKEVRPLHIYEPFNDTKDLLFKSSTNVLVDSSHSISAIDVYKDIMSHVDICTASASSITLLNFVAFMYIIIVYISM